MQLLSFGEKGSERAGVIYNDKIIDINKAFPDMPDNILEILKNGYIEKIKRKLQKGPALPKASIINSSVRIGPPIPNPGQIICLGLNYKDHAMESKGVFPDKPLLFAKSVSSINGPYDDIIHPGLDKTEKLDYEVELAVIIGKKTKGIKADEALKYIAGYSVFNDVTARDVQFNEKQWFRGKSFDTFAPLGPYLVTKDEIKDPNNLNIQSRVNGEIRQDSNTAKMIFHVPKIIEFISSCITLNPGDIIATGTPSGVGVFMDPPRFLKPDDVAEIEIEGLGKQRNKIIIEDRK